MRLHIARGWLIEMPDVISHSHAVQSRIVVPKPVSVNHPPRPVRDDLSRTDTLVSELSRKLVVIWVYDRIRRHHQLHYATGWGSGLVTGGALFGDLLGGGVAGSRVDDTGSSNGMTVYLLTGCPICAMATPPIAVFDCPLVLNIAGVATITNVR